MGFIANIVNGVAKAIPVLVQKIVTTFLVVFFLGALFGLYMLGTKGIIGIASLAFAIAAVYYKLDEGFLILVLYFMWVFFF